MTDIFLSYNREDQARAKLFADAFEVQGFKVWWDVGLRTGEAYDEVTEKALRTAKAVVVLWSKKSVQSRWVRAEATLADRNKTLVPCMIEPCERPIMFELTQTAELVHWNGDAGDRAWVAFLGDVRRFVAKGPVTATPAFKPLSAPVAPPPETPKPGGRGEAPTLAVLPFANRSGQTEDDVFVFGIVEDVIDALSQNAAVNVLSSSATARFRTGAIPDLAAMARDLGVRYVLEGNVRRAGASLRITAQLVEPATGRIVWTQKFDRPLSELAEMQEELVLDVAAQLDASVNRLEIERAVKKPSDLTAWEAVMSSMAAFSEFGPAALARAVELAAKAVAIDPNYGHAHAHLARCLAVFYCFMTPDDPEEVARIRAHADRALRLDPSNSLVLAGAAAAYNQTGDPRQALALAQKAVRQSPNSVLALAAHGEALMHHNRTDEAVQVIDHACRYGKAGPLILGYYGWKAVALMRASRWVEAEVVADEMLSFAPTLNYALIAKAILRQRSGDEAEAGVFMRSARAADPEITLDMWKMRSSRWNANSPTHDIVLDNLCAAWAASDIET